MVDTVETITPTPLVQTQVDTSAISAAPPVVDANTSPNIPSPIPAPTPTPSDNSSVTQTPEVPVAEAAKTPESSEAAKTSDTPTTVLGEALTDKPAEAPVTETKPAEGSEAPVEQKNEGGQSDETAPPPKYEPFTLPEDVKLDDKKLGEFTSLLAELETSGKASHEAVQAFGQKAVEFYVNEVKDVVNNITKVYQDAWDKQKVTWKEQFLADPEIGGNRFQTTVDSALTFIRTHGGTAEQQQEFRNLMETSGLGNHPAMIRLLAKAGEAMSEGKPLVATTPVSAPKSKVSTMYGTST
jgi:hypothetical protein